jgi:signal transduction histidine kinase
MPENSSEGNTSLPGKSAVLILCDDSAFSAALQSCWSSRPDAPVFQKTDSRTWKESRAQEAGLVVVAFVAAAVRDLALQACAAAGTPAVIAVTETRVVDEIRSRHPQALVIRQHGSGCEELVAMAAATLRLEQAYARAERAESLLAELRPLAEVGRFVLESRHQINNTLSSVLGNSELLLMEPKTLGSQAREQIRSIHKMSLRLYELVQRMGEVETDARKTNAAMLLPPRRSRIPLASASHEQGLTQPPHRIS